MASLKDLTRLFNGLSLVANEFAKRSLPAITGDVKTRALLSATKGKVRQYSHPEPSSSTAHAFPSTDSVIHFSDHPSDSTPPPPPPPTTTTTVTNNDDVADSSPEANQPETSNASVSAVEAEAKESEALSTSGTPPLKKRKPRERKVPATPFSRALGLVSVL